MSIKVSGGGGGGGGLTFRGGIIDFQATVIPAGGGADMKIDGAIKQSSDVSFTTGGTLITFLTAGWYCVYVNANLVSGTVQATSYRLSDDSNAVDQTSFHDADTGAAGRDVYLQTTGYFHFDPSGGTNTLGVTIFNDGSAGQTFNGYITAEYLGPAS